MLRLISWLFIFCVFANVAAAQQRVALVIGNSAYQHTGRLDNPKNDAADMATALTAVGFQVMTRIDLDKAQFDRTLREFSATLRTAEVGLFFYAGHGMQVAGRNYLVPIDAKADTADALDWELISLDLIHRTMERASTTNLIFLDACRNNPLARNLARTMGTRSTEIGRGLAAVGGGVGTLISFSTQPDNVALDGQGRNSPFAAALAKQIANSPDDLSALLIDVRNEVRKATQNTQVPWEHSALTARFHFRTAAASTRPGVGSTTEAAQSWAQIQNSTDVRMLEAFRRQYGATNPFFDRLAEARLEEVRRLARPQAAPATPSTGAVSVSGFQIERVSALKGKILGSERVQIDASKPNGAIAQCASRCTATANCIAFDLSLVYGGCSLFETVDKKEVLGGYISGVKGP